MARQPAASEQHGWQVWVAKSRSPWRRGVVLPLVWPIAVEWLLLKVQRSVASQEDEWQVSAGAVVGPQDLTGCSQSVPALGRGTPTVSFDIKRSSIALAAQRVRADTSVEHDRTASATPCNFRACSGSQTP